MKKIFFSLLAIAALASCAKTEDVFTEGDSEIKLAPVTKLQTKANYLGAVDGTTYPTQENFDVFAYWKNIPAGQEFTDGSMFLEGATAGGAEFTNKGNYWGGTKNYYWPKNGSLRFAAYSPAHLDVNHTLDGDLYEVAYEQPSNTAKTWDFLVAPTSPSYSMMTATEQVAVEFQHALSWITLKVVAKDADAAKAFDITKVTINGVNTKADFAAAMTDGIQYNEWSNWSTPAGYVVFEGNQMVTETVADIETTTAGTLVIPQTTTTVTVDFDQYGVNGTADTPGMTVTLDLVLDTDNTPWEPGKHYNYTLVFGLDEILINPSVADWTEVEVGELDTDAINVSTPAQLQAALDNPKATKITFQNDIAGRFIVPELAGRTLRIDGNGKKLTGSMFIDGKSDYLGAYTIFQNINFETSDVTGMTGEAFIYCGEGEGNNYRYPDAVTVQNCTFTATGAAVDGAVAVKFWSLENQLVVEDCIAEGLHSFIQLTSSQPTAELKVDGLTLTNSKNGISLGSNRKSTIRNSEILTREYGVRADGVNATLTVANTTINSNKPIIVRKHTNAANTYNVVLDKATLVPGQPFAVVFTNGKDDADFETPVGNYTITGADGYSVFPQSAVTSKETFAAALANDEVDVIELLADLTYAKTESVSIEKDVIINGNDFTITAGGGANKNASVSVSGEYDVTLSDANLIGGSIMAYYGADVELNDVDLTYNFTGSGRNLIYAASDNDKQAVVVVNGGTYDMTGGDGNSYVCAHGNAVVYINGGTFKGKGKGTSNVPIKAAAIGTYTGQVIISGGTFDFDPSSDYIASGNKHLPTQATIATGYKVVQDGSNWTVVAE